MNSFRFLIALILVIATMIIACSTSTQAPSPAPSPKPAATSTRIYNSNDASSLKVDLKTDGVWYTFQVVPEESEASYTVRELFFGQLAPQVSIGSTKIVEGLFIAGLQNGKLVLQSNRFQVDLRTLKSDNSLRDQAIQRSWLESSKYPFAEFTSTSINGLPAELAEDQQVAFKITGNMTIRNITKPMTFDVQAMLTNGDTIIGTGTAYLFMKDFGFDAPDIAGKLTVTDGVTLTVKGTAKLADVKK